MNGITEETILIDGREFVKGRFTGIGRVLEGLVDALVESGVTKQIVLAVENIEAIPNALIGQGGIEFEKLPKGTVRQERALSKFSKRGFVLFISPYRKLPLFGTRCRTIHIIHDVLDLTHPVYKKRLKVLLGMIRLKLALRRADLTWYDSSWSMEESRKLVGTVGRNPRIRHLGVDEKFKRERPQAYIQILRKYGLEPGYVLVVGNGLPHKNLGVLLHISKEVGRRLVFVGVKEKNMEYWVKKYPMSGALWIGHAAEEDLPAVMNGAFCLAQPSTAEGYGYPPLEAMACGVPAVVSSLPVLIETTGGHALYADPLSPREWLEKIKVLGDEETYKEFIEKGLKWVNPLRGRNGWSKHVSDVRELIEEE